LLKKDFRLGKELLYLIVEEIEGDSFLRQWFDLPERENWIFCWFCVYT